jgi:hypothetical protein
MVKAERLLRKQDIMPFPIKSTLIDREIAALRFSAAHHLDPLPISFRAIPHVPSRAAYEHL